MNYHPFVLPFFIGSLALFGMLIYQYIKWLAAFRNSDRRKILKAIFSLKIFGMIGEIFSESLLHRKIFKINTKLGFMHMSFAFGWFLLILLGTFEMKFQSHFEFNYPWEPIFFQYFIRESGGFPFARFFEITTDLLLAILLTGVVMAWSKRFYSRIFGLKKTTRHRFEDRVALTSLWLIFPLRFVSESVTSALCNNGSFLTGTGGKALAAIIPVSTLQSVELPLWWAYSSALCAFFVALPFSRYMHIPTEIVLIVLRRSGLKSGNTYSTFHDIEASSCPRCGICIDRCQVNSVLGKTEQLPVYFLHHVRNKDVTEETAQTCLQCGRCREVCPVSIDTIAVRNGQRQKTLADMASEYNYIPDLQIKEAKVLYFAGCMTHLTPTIKNSMTQILDNAGVNYEFMDKNGSICCGKPIMAAGNHNAAKELMNKNIAIIQKSKAQVLVTSCPICYHSFKNEYKLNIKVMHHTEYIEQLIAQNKISLKKQSTVFTYHDPCELGRLSGIYEAPRAVLQQAGKLVELSNNRGNALCCGASISNQTLSSDEKNRITIEALKNSVDSSAQKFVTACPLCKKQFAKFSELPIMDIAEVVAKLLVVKQEHKILPRKEKEVFEEILN
jgi:Fe-S oxidoreductase